jgi:hypothetical protein
MIEIYEKRGKWCYRDAAGKLFKFNTEEAAKSSLGLEIVNYAEEKIEKENPKEKTNTNKQKTVLNSKSSYKKKV